MPIEVVALPSNPPTSAGAGQATVSDPIAVVPNTHYRITGWIYKAAATGNVYVDLNDIPGEVTLAATQLSAWQYLSATWNSGTNTQVVLRLVTDGAINGNAWFDDVALMPVTVTTPGLTTTYYSAGAQMIAMREVTSTAYPAGTLYYLHTDHLGSTSLVTSITGSVVSRQSYYAYGGVRQTSGALPTDIGYTGQRLDGTGLMFYNARYYAPGLGRFVSADTIVPGGGPQSLNRYSYVLNSPLNYTDPTGHAQSCDGVTASDCGTTDPSQVWEYYAKRYPNNGYIADGYTTLYIALNTSRQSEEYQVLMDTARTTLQAGGINSSGDLEFNTDEWIWDHVPSAYSVHLGGSVQSGFFVEPFGAGEFDVVYNWRSGELSLMLTGGVGYYGGAPTGYSITGFAGVTEYYNASTNDSLSGGSLFGGVTASGDAIGKFGGTYTIGRSATNDPDRNKPVTFNQVDVTMSVNMLPNILDVGVFGGGSLTTNPVRLWPWSK